MSPYIKIKIVGKLRTLITITSNLINNNDDNDNIIINNNDIYILYIYIIYKRNKESSEDFFTHTHTTKTSQEFSNFNVYFLDIHRNLFELCLFHL